MTRHNGEELSMRQRTTCAGNGRTTASSSAGLEQGSRDWRMLPIAVLVWVGTLGTHAIAQRILNFSSSTDTPANPMNERLWVSARLSDSADHSDPSPVMVAVLIITIIIVGLAIVSMLVIWNKHRHTTGVATRHVKYSGKLPVGTSSFSSRWLRNATTMIMICNVLLIAAINTMICDIAAWRDPTAVLIRDGLHRVDVLARLNAPAEPSDIRGFDCQIDITVVSVSADARIYSMASYSYQAESTHANLNQHRVEQPSAARARLFAQNPTCASLRMGAVIGTSGLLQPAGFGETPAWLKLTGSSKITQLQRPDALATLVNTMHARFFSVTGRLSEQGRILVPGLTIGKLGQNIADSGHQQSQGIDRTYAILLVRQFKQSGIMHLMAVSGGHFALIGACLRRICAYVHAPRQLVALLLVGGYLFLAMLMVPSDSVNRALIMGLISAGTLAYGRRSQAISALSWTVVFTLMMRPHMVRSFGFALSCAAVLGITLCSSEIGALCDSFMPKPIARALAMTFSAQLFTLPIQILMVPQVPLLSVPANLLVAPVVTCATVCGLAALLLSSWFPDVAYIAAWLSSLATWVMERCAHWLGSNPSSVLAWPDGVRGSILVVCVEILGIAVPVWTIRRKLRTTNHVALNGMTDTISEWTYCRNPYQRMALWFAQTEDVLAGLFTDSRGSDACPPIRRH